MRKAPSNSASRPVGKKKVGHREKPMRGKAEGENSYGRGKRSQNGGKTAKAQQRDIHANLFSLKLEERNGTAGRKRGSNASTILKRSWHKKKKEQGNCSPNKGEHNTRWKEVHRIKRQSKEENKKEEYQYTKPKSCVSQSEENQSNQGLADIFSGNTHQLTTGFSLSVKKVDPGKPTARRESQGFCRWSSFQVTAGENN